MKRTLFLSALVVGVALALAAGSYSVLAGSGPVAGVASAVVGSDDPDDGDAFTANDVDGDDVDAQNDNGDNGEGARRNALAIAETFGGGVTAEATGLSQEDVLALHEEGIGFGALYKLYLLAAANSTSVDALLDTIPTNADGKYQFAFGKMFKEATTEVSALSAGEDGVPKNLGQAKKALK
ncbi:MAG: hypothetical protein IIA23_06370 [Chloroflexi bacterium]|nr:hypothetical protein [Chloroflexota bacterium]